MIVFEMKLFLGVSAPHLLVHLLEGGDAGGELEELIAVLHFDCYRHINQLYPFIRAAALTSHQMIYSDRI